METNHDLQPTPMPVNRAPPTTTNLSEAPPRLLRSAELKLKLDIPEMSGTFKSDEPRVNPLRVTRSAAQDFVPSSGSIRSCLSTEHSGPSRLGRRRWTYPPRDNLTPASLNPTSVLGYDILTATEGTRKCPVSGVACKMMPLVDQISRTQTSPRIRQIPPQWTKSPRRRSMIIIHCSQELPRQKSRITAKGNAL